MTLRITLLSAGLGLDAEAYFEMCALKGELHVPRGNPLKNPFAKADQSLCDLSLKRACKGAESQGHSESCAPINIGKSVAILKAQMQKSQPSC